MTLRALARILARNWQLKLAAFALSVFLWALVQVEGAGPLRSIPVAVDVELTEPGWVVVGDPVPSEVEVSFSGPATEVFQLGFNRPTIRVPINAVGESDTVVVLEPSWMPTQGFPGVQVEDIRPSTVRLHIEREEVRTIPLRVITRGEIPRNLALTRAISLTPNVIRVTGPQSIVDAIDSLDVVPPDLGAVTLDGVLEALVDTIGYLGVSVVPDRVSLRVPVEESMDRVIPGLPVEASQTAFGGVEVVPATVEIVVRGSRSRVSAVDPDDVRVFVPLSALQNLGPSEERRVPVVIDGLPDLVDWVSSDSVLVRRSER